MAKAKSDRHIEITDCERSSLEQWVNGGYHLRWAHRNDKPTIEKLITCTKLTKADIRKGVAALKRARAEGTRRINEYGHIPRDKVALGRLDEQIRYFARYAA